MLGIYIVYLFHKSQTSSRGDTEDCIRQVVGHNMLYKIFIPMLPSVFPNCVI